MVYQDEDGNTKIIKLKPEDVIIVYENTSTKQPLYKIRLYVIDTEDTDKTTMYAEVWSATKMELFKRVDDSIIPGSAGFAFEREETHIFGKIPIITLYNNEEEMSDLEKIESLINDYDRVMSDISDEFEAFRNAYLVIKDMVMNGDSLQKLKEEGIVEVTDAGDMKFITKEIQTEAINSHLERLEKNVHKFAQVPDLSDENFAGNLSGVAIRFKLFGLETKCITKERKMDKAIRQLVEVFVDFSQEDLRNAPDGEDGKKSVTYRGEENLWGNIWTWLDGINIECKDIQNAYVSSDNLTMKDDTKENYENAGFTLAKAGGWVSKFGFDAAHPYLFLPTETKGASNFVGANHWNNPTYNGFMVALLGGSWDYGGYCSPFCLYVDAASGSRNRNVGGRLLYVPQADKPKYLYKVMAA